MKSTPVNRSARRHRSLGFSMVELMVAVAIGLIGTTVIFQVFSIFEAQKRTATSAGDAQQNGLFALYSIERDARMAGFGINYFALLGCNVASYDAQTGRNGFTFPLAAVNIAEGASGAADTITFLYGSSNLLIAPGQLLVPMNSADTSVQISNEFGFQAGDVAIVGAAGVGCDLREITGLPSYPNGNTMNFTSGGSYTNAVGGTQTPRYNNPGGLSVGFYDKWNTLTSSGGVVISLGSTPTLITYSVQSAELMYQNVLQTTTASPLVDGIVQLQAQYGLDLNGDGLIQASEWVNGCANPVQLPVGAGGTCVAPTSTQWSQVLALRIAVVARSTQPERPDQTTQTCTATTDGTESSPTYPLPPGGGSWPDTRPTWNSGTVIDITTVSSDWRCYRYRVFQTSIPIRNQLWFPA